MTEQDISLAGIIRSLNKELEVFKSSFPGYISPEYERQFLNNYKRYLLELDKLEKEIAISVTKEGIRFADAEIRSFDDDSAIIELLELPFRNIHKPPAEITENKTIRNAVRTKPPERFGHNPGTDAIITKKAEKHWHIHVQLNKHQLAELYVKRTERAFTEVDIMKKYHQIRVANSNHNSDEKRRSKINVEEANQVLIEWLKSYGIEKEDVYKDLGLSLEDPNVFNRRYNRWLKKS